MEIHGTLGSKDIRRYHILSTMYKELMEIHDVGLDEKKIPTYVWSHTVGI